MICHIAIGNKQKSKYMIVGKTLFYDDVRLRLNSSPIVMDEFLDILGVKFSSSHTYDDHAKCRINSARHSLSSVGVAYPFLAMK